MHTYTHTYIHTYIHYIHAHIHTYIHTYHSERSRIVGSLWGKLIQNATSANPSSWFRRLKGSWKVKTIRPLLNPLNFDIYKMCINWRWSRKIMNSYLPASFICVTTQCLSVKSGNGMVHNEIIQPRLIFTPIGQIQPQFYVKFKLK